MVESLSPLTKGESTAWETPKFPGGHRTKQCCNPGPYLPQMQSLTPCFLHAHFKTQPLSWRKDKDSINQHEVHFMLRLKFSSKTRTDPSFTFNSVYISTNAAIHPRGWRAARGRTGERTDRARGADGRPARREAAGQPGRIPSGRPGSERPATRCLTALSRWPRSAQRFRARGAAAGGEGTPRAAALRFAHRFFLNLISKRKKERFCLETRGNKTRKPEEK